MKFRILVEYEYPVEHKLPVKAELILHGDRIVTDNIKPLPKGHGRLIDAKDVGEYLTLADVPTIIEADKGDK